MRIYTAAAAAAYPLLLFLTISLSLSISIDDLMGDEENTFSHSFSRLAITACCLESF